VPKATDRTREKSTLSDSNLFCKLPRFSAIEEKNGQKKNDLALCNDMLL
jgi:hypothetical protein